MDKPGHVVTPIQNGGFSLRSRRFMRALIDHPHIRVEIPPPDAVEGDPLKMHWQHNALLEDVQLSGVLRPALEAVGMRFAPLEVARSFSIEHAGPQLHHGYNAMLLFGHHAKLRQLASLSPLTLRSLIPLSELDAWYGERDILQMFERNGYRIEFAPEPVASNAAPRKVYDCITYNGEADILAARLHELADVVDCFVVVEADRTFSGEPKALRFDAADPRIASFLPRIRYIAVHDMPVVDEAADAVPVVGDWHSDTPKSGFWIREKFQRNQIVRGLHDAAPDDLVLISDADEIPRASVVQAMRDDRAARALRAVPGLLLLLCELPQRRGAGGIVRVDRRGDARAARCAHARPVAHADSHRCAARADPCGRRLASLVPRDGRGCGARQDPRLRAPGIQRAGIPGRHRHPRAAGFGQGSLRPSGLCVARGRARRGAAVAGQPASAGASVRTECLPRQRATPRSPMSPSSRAPSVSGSAMRTAIFFRPARPSSGGACSISAATTARALIGCARTRR
jgi:hypothetical protein